MLSRLLKKVFVIGCVGVAVQNFASAIECNSSIEIPEDIGDEFPTFPKGTNSLISQYLDNEIWDKLKYRKDNMRFTLQHAIFSGCKNVDSKVGIYASSPDTYMAFGPLFRRIIDNIHVLKHI